MTAHDPERRSSGGQHAFAVVVLSLCASAAAAVADREQGQPIISTFLPTSFNTPAAPVGPRPGEGVVIQRETY